MSNAAEHASRFLDYLEGNELGIEDVIHDPSQATDSCALVDLLLDTMSGVDPTDPNIRDQVQKVLQQRGYLNEVSAGPIGTPFDTAASMPGPSTIGPQPKTPRSREDVAYTNVARLLRKKFKQISPEDLAALEAMSSSVRNKSVMNKLGLDPSDSEQQRLVGQWLPKLMKLAGGRSMRKTAARAVNEASTEIMRPADAMVSKREQLDAIKRRMRGVADTLSMTVDGLQDDIPQIGGRGVTIRDLHGAVLSLMRGADELLDHIEELASLREVRLREGWGDGPDLMAMTCEQLRQLYNQTDDPELRDTIERVLEDRKAAYRMGGHRGAR